MERLIPPVAPDEFKFAFMVAMAASAKKGPYVNPSNYGVNFRNDDTGEIVRYSPTDNALSRAALAVREQFEDSPKCASIMMRIHGMMDLIDDDRMKPYVRSGVNAPMEVRQEVLEVAAECEMSAVRGFDTHRFFSEVGQRFEPTSG
ncbi:hypothetical protein SAMN04488061_2861 [Filomicrobium insigne]|uniref:Uncharacterized protein n=1 Tax=Filomicrobium insigne TaxID=418854 RepID=A0A1H0SEK5_9HYPH|nr:hypothetical protein [Filomicrobium insigne]SDP40105.1 hypothetical protein SAMN04488061_2861 [Filomicrobium insigne]